MADFRAAEEEEVAVEAVEEVEEEVVETPGSRGVGAFDPEAEAAREKAAAPFADHPWAAAQLGADGWHPQAGSPEERYRALATFGLGEFGATTSPQDMARWYADASPWHALKSPHR
jgi:hypothetical protein